MKYAIKFASLFLFVVFHSFAQTTENDPLVKLLKDMYFVTWNKNTPEQQMKDDVKVFAEKGVTLKYSNVKRNESNEIIAITISYKTKIGEKGSLSYDNIKPIGDIKIYKQNNEVGFGQTPMFPAGLTFSSSVDPEDTMMKNYKYSYPNEKPSGPRIITSIQRTGKEPLIIEDGKVIEGGSDYTKEEIDEFIKQSNESSTGVVGYKQFNYKKGNQDFSRQLEQIQKQLDDLKQKQENN
ncbi:hypothetical protein [Flavobacterium sp.]|jgi:hypothetical protein|uniref:hypothetical protein n=1 Tax=Flavobacterium sp. TaxID=239 RepID=UPI0037C0D658